MGVGVAVLYFARAVLIPITLAMLLMFLLNPLVDRLQKLLRPRALAVALVLMVMLAAIGSVSMVVGSQILGLAQNAPAYRETIIRKVRVIRETVHGAMKGADQTISAIGAEINTSTQPDPADGTLAQTAPEPPASTGAELPAAPSAAAIQQPWDFIVGVVQPVISPIAFILVVLLLLAMMLTFPEQIRDPIIRLAGLRQINLTTQALEEAGTRVSAYLRAQLLINVIFGTVISGGLLALSVPGALVCGLLAGLLRFVPLVGVWLGVALPAALAIAAFDDWMHLLLVLAVFTAAELVNNFVLEPWLYSARTGISRLGMVVAVVFWTWIWGAAGLVLAMPLSVCVLVFARQIPRLRILPILFDDQPALSQFARFYQRLLADETDEAAAILAGAEPEVSSIDRLDQVVVPALGAVRREWRQNTLSDATAVRVAQDIREVTIDWLADRETEGPSPPTDQDYSRPIMCVPVVDECDQCAAEILTACLERCEWSARTTSSSLLMNEVLAEAAESNTPIMVLSAISPTSQVHLRRICKVIRRRLPDIPLVICQWNQPTGNNHAVSPEACQIDDVASNFREALAAIAAAWRPIPRSDNEPARRRINKAGRMQ